MVVPFYVLGYQQTPGAHSSGRRSVPCLASQPHQCRLLVRKSHLPLLGETFLLEIADKSTSKVCQLSTRTYRVIRKTHLALSTRGSKLSLIVLGSSQKQ